MRRHSEHPSSLRFPSPPFPSTLVLHHSLSHSYHPSSSQARRSRRYDENSETPKKVRATVTRMATKAYGSSTALVMPPGPHRSLCFPSDVNAAAHARKSQCYRYMHPSTGPLPQRHTCVVPQPPCQKSAPTTTIQDPQRRTMETDRGQLKTVGSTIVLSGLHTLHLHPTGPIVQRTSRHEATCACQSSHSSFLLRRFLFSVQRRPRAVEFWWGV